MSKSFKSDYRYSSYEDEEIQLQRNKKLKFKPAKILKFKNRQQNIKEKEEFKNNPPDFINE